jgi:hypothetical protein
MGQPSAAPENQIERPQGGRKLCTENVTSEAVQGIQRDI